MAFVFCDKSDTVTLRFPHGSFAGARELLSGRSIAMRATAEGQVAEIPMSEWGMAVLLGG